MLRMYLAGLCLVHGLSFAADAITLDQSVNGRQIKITKPRFYMCDDYQITHKGATSTAHPEWEPNSTHLTCKKSDPVFDLAIPNCTPKIVTKSPGQRTLSCI
jgi:hypothetical protein